MSVVKKTPVTLKAKPTVIYQSKPSAKERSKPSINLRARSSVNEKSKSPNYKVTSSSSSENDGSSDSEFLPLCVLSKRENPKPSTSEKATPSIKSKSSAIRRPRPAAVSDDETKAIKVGFNFDIKNTGLFMQKWILLEKIPIVPHTSPVYRVVTKEGFYGDLRCFSKEEQPRLSMELMCLDKMEKQGQGHMFRKVCEMKMVNSEKDGFMAYVVMYHRPGIPLSNIVSQQKTLDAGSGTRFGIEMLEIVENLAKAKILMTDISPDHFVIDQYSSKLFLSNASSLIGNTERFNINNNFVFPSWKGSIAYAPLRWHTEPDAPLTEGDVVESTFYVFLDIIGKLPWKYSTVEDVVLMKKRHNTSDMNQLRGSELHPSLITCLLAIRRGQMLDVCRTKVLTNGAILLHKFRDLGLNDKQPVPTGAMMEYGAIYTAMRAFAGNGNVMMNLPLPVTLSKPHPDPARATLIDQLMRQKLERDALRVEIQALQKMVNSRHIHNKQLDAEVANNERFILKYVFEQDDLEIKKSEKVSHDVPAEEPEHIPIVANEEPPDVDNHHLAEL